MSLRPPAKRRCKAHTSRDTEMTLPAVPAGPAPGATTSPAISIGTMTDGAYLWNGPVCPTCHTPYIGSHQCTVEDLQRRINELQAALDKARVARISTLPTIAPTWGRGCTGACQSSGICNNVMCGPQVTC